MKEVEDHFKLLPPEVNDFDHFTLARFLMENAVNFHGVAGIDVALDRFEKLFGTLNASSLAPSRR